MSSIPMEFETARVRAYEAALARPTPVPRRARARRIVLLDDEPAILRTWKAILEVHGFDPVCCESAADALLAMAQGCDCVVTDYHMRDMTGIEVIVAAKLLTRAQVILMTADDSPKLRSAAAAAGAACVVGKPAPIAGVIEIIDRLSAPQT